MKINHSEKAVWDIFSKFIRARDADWRGYVRCISCGCIKNWKDGIDAGHFIAQGSDSALKYNEINVNGQCSEYCNRRMSGNLIMYRIGLVRKVGEEKVKLLEQSHFFKTTKKRPNQLELNAMYDYYSQKFKELKKEKCLD
jgi:hypothetical protein